MSYGITLNDEQLDAVSNISDWLDDKADKEYMLEGRAGTGKTTTVGQLPIKQAIGVTISHKAKEILYQSFNEKIDCFTIAQVLGHEKLDDYSSGKSTFGKTVFGDKKLLIQELKAIRNLLIIVDECSMISSNIRKELLTLYPRAKFLYLGDPFQIPPILKKDEKSVSIFESDIQASYLTKNQRCGDENPLKKLLNSIVASQEELKDEYSKWLGVNRNYNKDGIGYEVNPKISDFWLDEDCFFITFTRKAKDNWNKLVREKIYNRTAALEEGDRLIFDDNIYYRDQYGETSRVHTNSDIITVEKIEVVNQVLEYYQLGELQESMMSFYRVNEDETFFIPTQSTELLLKSAITSTFNSAKNIKDKFERKKRFRAFFKLKKYERKTSFAYAITAHKSQGSTYKRVIVDYPDIMRDRKINSYLFRLQLLYVACSRAREKVGIIK